MRIAVWKTLHEIADKIATAVCDGLQIQEARVFDGNYGQLEQFDAHIAYGILRGTADIFKWCSTHGKPWFCVDRGYWKPGHYDGYYRISLNGTQQTTGLDKIEPDYDRWGKLGLTIRDEIKPRAEMRILICPPTDEVRSFFNLPPDAIPSHPMWIVRHKNSPTDLQEDLNRCSRVVTFNSSVGWEALRQGIPVIRSSPAHSILGAYQKQVDAMSQMSVESRRRFFAVQAGLQLTLAEIRSGLLWPLLQKLLTSSLVMTGAKL